MCVLFFLTPYTYYVYSIWLSTVLGSYLSLIFLGLNATPERYRDARFASWPSTRHVPGCKRWALCVRPAGITSLGVKMYRKETAVYTQSVFMGMGPVRKARKETEGGDRYGRGQRIRARSFNQPANHRTIRPTSPQRLKHLTLNSPYQ